MEGSRAEAPLRVTGIKTFCCHGDGRKYVVVKVETDADIHGLGEAGIGHWGGAIEQAVRHLAEVVVGEDPLATERIWQRTFRGGFFPADRVYCSAISAIDVALWDVKSKALGVPVYKLLGGPVRDKVVCYPHVQADDTSRLLQNCRDAVAAGWRFLRWHLPTGTDQPDVLDPARAVRLAEEQMAAVREAVGDDVQLCLDVHTRLGTAAAIELCNRLAPLRPFFIEDPLRSENPASYRTLERHVNTPIAAGEQWASKWAFREVVEEELVRYARIDIGIVGGLTEALKITHWCETHGIDIVPHNPLGPVSAAAGVALCMAAANVGVQEMPRAPGSFATDLFPAQVRWLRGYAACRDVPGLGVEFNEALALARPAPPNSWPPQMRRGDGAFTNW